MLVEVKVDEKEKRYDRLKFLKLRWRWR